MNKFLLTVISLTVLFICGLSLAQDIYVYPNKRLADQGLIEYRQYTLEEARAYEQGGSFEPYLTAAWGATQRLTNQSNIYTTKMLSIGETLLCAYETVYGRQTYFIKSIDNGSTWGNYTALGDTPFVRAYFSPELSQYGESLFFGVHIYSFDQGGYNPAFFRSFNLGETWEPLRIIFGYYSNQSGNASVANDNTRLYYAYDEYDHDSIYVLISSNWGNTWNGRGNNVAYLNSTPQNLTLRAGGDFVHLVWINQEGVINVRYSRSMDRGTIWSPEDYISNDSLGAQWGHLAIDGPHIVVSWMGYKYSPYMFTGDFFIKQSFDNGATWDNENVITTAHKVGATSIYIKDSLMVAAWVDSRFGSSGPGIMARISTDYGFNWGTEVRVTDDTSDAFPPTITSTENIIHTIWGDNRSDVPGLYYRSNDLLSSIDDDYTNNQFDSVSINLTNYPNPFNNFTSIKYSGLSSKSGVLDLFDVRGRKIRTFALLNNEGEILWDTKDYLGYYIASGIYFAKITSGSKSVTTKIEYLK